jgi:hypothetical protein
MGFELTRLGDIGTDCTCSWKSNYHMITPTIGWRLTSCKSKRQKLSHYHKNCHSSLETTMQSLQRTNQNVRATYTNFVTDGWSWSYGSWIYNYLCNPCLSPLMLWVRIPLMARCTRYNIMWWSLSVTWDRSGAWYAYHEQKKSKYFHRKLVQG